MWLYIPHPQCEEHQGPTLWACAANCFLFRLSLHLFTVIWHIRSTWDRKPLRSSTRGEQLIQSLAGAVVVSRMGTLCESKHLHTNCLCYTYMHVRSNWSLLQNVWQSPKLRRTVICVGALNCFHAFLTFRLLSHCAWVFGIALLLHHTNKTCLAYFFMHAHAPSKELQKSSRSSVAPLFLF